MFSELIKREVTKLILVIFLYTNLSPSFCMQGMPEYVINIERRQVGKEERAEVQTAFAVTAMQLIQEGVATVYKTIVDQIIYPFMLATTMTLEASIRLYEVLQNVKANITDGEKDAIDSDEINTEISHGFCLNIPEIGDLLISHDGDVVLNAERQLEKSIRIVAPKQVILNGVIAKDIEVESTAAILTGKTSAKIDCLSFKANGESEDLENALFIDEGSNLEVGMLSLESALLLNTGRLTVERSIDLQQGIFFNTGVLETTADPVTLKNIAYFYNGTRGDITSVGDIILNGGRVINAGKIEARGINLVSSELFHNEGEILTSRFFNINGLGELINEGKINGSSGTIDIRGAGFEQRQGYLLGSKIILNTGESILSGEVIGSEGFFHGNIQNIGVLNFQRGVLNGDFVNSGNINIERLIELIGTRAIIRNTGELKAGEIVSESTEGVIRTELGGKIITETITSKKHLQLEADMPILKTVKTEKGGKLLITKESKTPKLQKIENHGDSTFILGDTELSIIQNTVDSFLRLESVSPFEKLSGFDELQGTVMLKGIFPRLIKLNILNGSKFTLLPGSCFTEVKEVYIESKGQLDILDNVFKNLQTMTNSGALILRGEGEQTAQTELITPAQDGLVIRGIYKGEVGSILQLESGGKVSANDWDNSGKILSRHGLKVTHNGGNVTKWGNMESGGDINYEVKGVDIGVDNGFINPMAKGKVRIASNRNITIPTSFESSADLELQSENLTIPGKLKTKKLKVKTKKFTLTGYVGSRENVEVICDEFTNTSGRFESLGDLIFNVAGTFTNTGGMRKEQQPVTFTYYTQSPSVVNKTYSHWAARQIYRDYPSTDRFGNLSRVSLQPQQGTTVILTDSRDISKSGQIGSLGTFRIKSRDGNNNFGVLFGGDILFETRFNNVNGIIYSRNGIQVNGSLMNGFTDTFFSVQNAARDPNKPIWKTENLPVGANWDRHSHTFHGATFTFRDYIRKPFQVIVGYTPYAGGKVPIHTQPYPGYIFGEGDIRIDSAFDTTLGTIVSGQNIYIGGRNQTGTANLIAHGNIEMAMRQADLNQIKARAENIVMEQLKSLVIGGYITPVIISDTQKGLVINLEKLAGPLGLALSERPMLTDASSLGMSLSIVPVPRGLDSEVVLRNPSNIGFTLPTISAVPFIPTIPDLVTAKLLRLVVTPLYGTEIGFNVNLTGILERNGRELMQSFVYSKNCDIPDGALALVYGEEKEGEAREDGVIVPVRQRTPYLFVGNVINEAVHYLKARQEAILRSEEGSITIKPEDFNIDSKNLTIEADENVELLTDYIYTDSRRIGVKPVEIDVPGRLSITAGQSVTNRAARLNAEEITIEAQKGSITEQAMELDLVSQRVSRTSVVSQSSVVVPELKAGSVIREIAPEGSIEQTGTIMKAGKAIELEAKKHIVKPAYVTTQVTTHSGNTTSSIRMRTPKGSVFESPEILFNSKDTTLIGAQIISSRVINSGNIYVTCAEGKRESHATTVSRRRCFGIRIGKSTQTVHSQESFYEPTRIIGDYFESSETGKCTLEGAVVDVLEMAIKKKDLIDRTFYTKRITHITRRSSGFFAPRIKGDPFYESSRALGKVVTFGDIVPSALNVVGAGAQTLTHATMLANLSKVNNPLATISQIFMSRFVSGFGYSNITQRTRIVETIPHQTHAKVGILKVSNDRTHLEGVWDVDEAEIDTKLFTTSAPKYQATQETETEGFSVSLSPAALLSAAIAPGIASNLACLPSMSVSEADGHMERTSYLPVRFNANKLFVQCDKAVFTGAQIRAKAIEMIITGDLTIESLRDTLRVRSSDSVINGSLAAVFSSMHKVDNRAIIDPRLGAVPTLRIADEEEITEKVNTLAELVGEEKFYLKVGGLLYQKGAEVGLRPDGIVSRTAEEKIEAERILKANVSETHVHKSHVINPTVGELVACMGQIDEFKQVRAQFITERLAEGATMAEAAEEGEKLQELLETPEVKESYKEIKAANERLIQAAEKIEKIDRETREKAAGMSQPQMEEFLKASFQSIERQNAVQEYNSIAHTCLVQATRMRIGIQNWAKEHPTCTRVAEMAMDTVRYSVAITSTVALVSSFAATAPVSIPVAIAGVGITMAKDMLIDWGIEELVNFAGKQGNNELEVREFRETVLWIANEVKDIKTIHSLGKVIKDPVKPIEDISLTYNSLDNLQKYAKVTMILNKNINAYSRSRSKELLSEILCELAKGRR